MAYVVNVDVLSTLGHETHLDQHVGQAAALGWCLSSVTRHLSCDGDVGGDRPLSSSGLIDQDLERPVAIIGDNAAWSFSTCSRK